MIDYDMSAELAEFLYSTGAYSIYNTVNGKVYIGSSSSSLKGRIRQHLNSLRKGNHHNQHLSAGSPGQRQKVLRGLVAGAFLG